MPRCWQAQLMMLLTSVEQCLMQSMKTSRLSLHMQEDTESLHASYSRPWPSLEVVLKVESLLSASPSAEAVEAEEYHFVPCVEVVIH